LLLLTSASAGLVSGAPTGRTYTAKGSVSRDERPDQSPAASESVGPQGCLLESMQSFVQSSDRRIEYCFDLRGEDPEDSSAEIVAGKFCVIGRIETELKVRVEAAEGYKLLKNHIWVGDDMADIPLKANGDVDVLKFPENGCDSNAELTEAIWTIHENYNPCQINIATKVFYAVGKSMVENIETGKTSIVYPTEHAPNDQSPLPWVDVTLWCGCDGFYVRRRNLRGLQKEEKENKADQAAEEFQKETSDNTMKAFDELGIEDNPAALVDFVEDCDGEDCDEELEEILADEDRKGKAFVKEEEEAMGLDEEEEETP